MNLDELRDLITNYSSTIGTQVTSINNLYKNRIREIKSRVSFGYKVTSQATTYSSGYYSYSYYHGELETALTPLQNIERGIKRLIIKTEADNVPIATAVASSLELDIHFDNNISSLLRNGLNNVDINIIKVETGIKQNDGTYLWWVVGYYKINELKEISPKFYKITAYDFMYELSNKKITLNTNRNNITNGKNLFKCSSWNTPDDLIALMDDKTSEQLMAIPMTSEDATALEGRTVREALAWMSAKVGKYAHFTEGAYGNEFINIALRIDSMSGFATINTNYNSDPEYRIDFTKEDRIKVNKICIGSDSCSLSFEEQTGITYYFDCPLVDDPNDTSSVWANIISALWSSMPADNEFGAFEYEIGELKTSGNILWDIGQTISFYDCYGVYHRILVCGYELDLSSGVSMIIYSKAPQTEFNTN